MPIPDKTIFGPHLTEPRGIEFGEVRLVTDLDEKLKYLKLRLEGFLTSQIDNASKTYCPFPLTVMTCIAVETLGRVIEPIAKYETDPKKNKEIPKIVSTKIYGMLDKKLTRQLTKEFKEKMHEIWPTDNVKNISCYSELFHSYLRTTFIHGYRGKNVFLDDSLQEGWSVDDGYLVLNPHWFWASYKRVFNECFEKIFDTKEINNPYRNNALEYFDNLINE